MQEHEAMKIIDQFIDVEKFFKLIEGKKHRLLDNPSHAYLCMVHSVKGFDNPLLSE